jgi:glycosyltransferase involved in cell wall biosynthesis
MTSLRILHVSVGLESGGAETVLYKLASRTDRSRFEPHVVSLTDEGPQIGRRMREANIPLTALGFRRGSPNPNLVLRLIREIRRVRPQLVQTWMYHADLVGGLAGQFVRGVPIIWGLHNSNFDPNRAKRSLLRVIAINRYLSRWLPTRVVCCSEAVKTIHANLGYDAAKLHTIPNGLDTDEFIPIPNAASILRRELNVAPDTILIGYVARWDPQKDHATFLSAAKQLAQQRSDVHFLLCGAGMDASNSELARLAAGANLGDRLHLLGLRNDVPVVTAGLDVASCSSSYGESFALVLGEAMACGVPVVSTNLPGPASVIGEEGWVVPVGDAPAMAAAWRDALGMRLEERRALGIRARQRILENFSIQKMVEGYESLYTEVAGAGLDTAPKAGVVAPTSR